MAHVISVHAMQQCSIP